MRALIFDLDGTLWDATDGIAVSWRAALEVEPDILQLPSKAQLRAVMGMTSTQLMSTLFPNLSPERGQALFEKCCAAEDVYLLEHGGRLFPGLIDTLETLSAQVPLAIVSNCGPTYVPMFLQAHGLGKYFADWECIGRTGKEKWENIQLVARRLGLSHPVYVGDTALDCASAEKAGVPFIHAAYGFGRVEGHPAVQAPKDLLELLEFPKA